MSFLSQHIARETGTKDPVTGEYPLPDHTKIEPVHPGHHPASTNTPEEKKEK